MYNGLYASRCAYRASQQQPESAALLEEMGFFQCPQTSAPKALSTAVPFSDVICLWCQSFEYLLMPCPQHSIAGSLSLSLPLLYVPEHVYMQARGQPQGLPQSPSTIFSLRQVLSQKQKLADTDSGVSQGIQALSASISAGLPRLQVAPCFSCVVWVLNTAPHVFLQPMLS